LASHILAETQPGVARTIARAFAASATLPEAMLRLLEGLGPQLRFAAGLYWERDAAANVLRFVMIWRAPDIIIPDFEAASRARVFRRGEGLPGRVWEQGKWTVIRDLSTDTNFPRRDSGLRDQLRSAVAFPIGDGVLEFFQREGTLDEHQLEETAQLLAAHLEEFLRRTAALEAERISEARRAAILDAALDSIVSMDAAGRVTDWNAAAERMFGWSREEALGREMAELIVPPSLRENHRRGLARYLKTRQSALLNRRLELLGMRKDGSEFPVELTIARIPLEGTLAFTGYLRDLTERRRAEAESREREAFRERFIGILGHDLRSPIQAILGSTYQLKKAALSETEHQSLARIGISAQRMSRMIDDLLDLTRGRLGGGIPVSPRTMDLGQTAAQVIEETRAAHPGREIVLEAQGEASGQWDPDRMEQLLSNLTVNAVVHGAPNRPVRIGITATADHVEIAVHNEGTPIPEGDRERIFDPFRRAAPESGKGLGLGLYIAREIVRAHGGELSLDSSAEQGTTFRALLPRLR